MDIEEAAAGLPWRGIAASAYRAYGYKVGWKNYQGLPMPKWDELTPAIRAAWEAAARHVQLCIHSGPATDLTAAEQRWAGWKSQEEQAGMGETIK